VEYFVASYLQPYYTQGENRMEEEPTKPDLTELLRKWKADNWLRRFNQRDEDE